MSPVLYLHEVSVVLVLHVQNINICGSREILLDGII